MSLFFCEPSKRSLGPWLVLYVLVFTAGCFVLWPRELFTAAAAAPAPALASPRRASPAAGGSACGASTAGSAGTPVARGPAWCHWTSQAHAQGPLTAATCCRRSRWCAAAAGAAHAVLQLHCAVPCLRSTGTALCCCSCFAAWRQETLPAASCRSSMLHPPACLTPRCRRAPT